MIALLFALLTLLPHERIYSGTLAYSSQVETVPASRQWEGYQDFDLLLATENCNDLARWAWVIVDGQVYSALIVDCAKPVDRATMIKNGIVADVNKKGLSGLEGWIVIR